MSSNDDHSPRRSTLTAIKRSRRSREVRLQLEEAIRVGEFRRGERLPSERELVETFGVSRVSVREALRSLEALGQVKIEHGRGAFVADRRSGLAGPLSSWLEQHRDEVADLYAVRGALDVLAAELAAGASARRVAAIVAAHKDFKAAVERGDEPHVLVELDIAFHLRIAEASDNGLLYDLLGELHDYLAESRYSAFSHPERPPLSAAEHEAIVDAIVAADPTGARDALTAHLSSSTSDIVPGGPRRRARA